MLNRFVSCFLTLVCGGPKRSCLLVKKPPLARNIAVRKTDDKIYNTALFHIKLARPRSINVRIPMVYFDLLYLSLLMGKQHMKLRLQDLD